MKCGGGNSFTRNFISFIAELLEFIIFSLEKIKYFLLNSIFLNKNWIYSDRFSCDFFDAIVGIYESAPLYRSNSRKLQKNVFFLIKIDFYSQKILYQFKSGSTLIDTLSDLFHQIFPKKQSYFDVSFSVRSCDRKTAENFWNFYVSEKRIVSNL